MNKTQLVLYAHGSRDPDWRAPFLRMRDSLSNTLGEDRVTLAFMEFASPTLLDVAARATSRGIATLRLLPLFLAGGAHVARDIPEQVKEVEATYPELHVEVLPPVGEDPRFISLLQTIAAEKARED